eukprot:g3876.t1
MIGSEIFERKSNPLRISPVGDRLLASAYEIEKILKQTDRDVARIAEGKAGQLRIAVECHSCFDWLMPSMDAFREGWPEVEMDLVSGFHADPIGLLTEDKADLVIVSSAKARSGVSYHPLFRYEVLALMARQHPLTHKSYLTARDFREETLVTYPIPDERIDVIREMKLLFSLLIATVLSAQAAFDHTHRKFTEVLQENVTGKNVDYAKLREEPGKLGTYIEALAGVSESDFEKWTDQQQIAYLINLYNAATLKLIIDNYPVDSIRDIRNPWKQKRVRLFGDHVSLDHIEHEILRKNYREPRIHFAVNCASVGCPPLRPEAFVAAELDNQLDEQTRAFLRDETKNRLDAKAGTLHLSKIFDWFREDFTKESGTLDNFVAGYFSEADRNAMKGETFSIRFTDYDWSLNGQ